MCFVTFVMKCFTNFRHSSEHCQWNIFATLFPKIMFVIAYFAQNVINYISMLCYVIKVFKLCVIYDILKGYIICYRCLTNLVIFIASHARLIHTSVSSMETSCSVRILTYTDCRCAFCFDILLTIFCSSLFPVFFGVVFSVWMLSLFSKLASWDQGYVPR